MKKKFSLLNKNSSKCTSRCVECSFDSQDDFFTECPESFCSGWKNLTQMEIFQKKSFFQIFSMTVKTIFLKNG